MWQEFDPVETAVRRLLQQIGPQLSSTGAADWTDAERIAVARLLNAGLLEVEYRINVKQEGKNRAAVVLARLSGGVCKPTRILGEVVITLGWHTPGVPLDAGVVAESMDIVQWRLTEQGERAVCDLARGRSFPVEWVMCDRPPCPKFFVVSMEPAPVEATQAPDAATAGERSPVSVDVNSSIDLTLNGNLPTVTDNDQKSEAKQTEPVQASALRPFDGGMMLFFPDRVELCGVEICRGPGNRRRLLDLLRQTTTDGAYRAHSGARIAEHLHLASERTAAGLVRDVRSQIVDSLKSQANLDCQRDQVIKSGGPGYRFTECLSVQLVDEPAIGDTTNRDNRQDVPHVPNDDVPNVPDGTPGTRRAWILEQLAEGKRLKVWDVVAQFGCSAKTAKRDLKALKAENRIKFVGSSASGHYRLCPPPESN